MKELIEPPKNDASNVSIKERLKGTPPNGANINLIVANKNTLENPAQFIL